MKIASLRDVKQGLSKHIRNLDGRPVIITKNGKPCAALVDLSGSVDMEAFLYAHNRRLRDLLQEAKESRPRVSMNDIDRMMESADKQEKRRRKAA